MKSLWDWNPIPLIFVVLVMVLAYRVEGWLGILGFVVGFVFLFFIALGGSRGV